MEEDGSPTKFLLNVQSKHLKEILKYLEIEVETKDKMVDTLVNLADEMGLEKLFSSFPVSKLKEFIKTCGLKIDSESLDTLLTSLIEQESIKAPFKSTESPSKNQPKIDDNISVVDLHHHYFREDLAEWCKKNELISNGSKKELVDRIRRKFDKKLIVGRDVKVPKPDPKRKRTEKEQKDEKDKSSDSETTPKATKQQKTSKKPEKSSSKSEED